VAGFEFGKGTLPSLAALEHVQPPERATNMHKATVTIAALLFAVPAFAQTTTTTTTGVAPAATVVVEPAQRTKIKQYVVEKKVQPIRLKERVTVGAALPADVELQTVPTDWGPQLSSYRYVYSGDDVVLVEPSSRRVVQIID
jgi:hypothetical protein